MPRSLPTLTRLCQGCLGSSVTRLGIKATHSATFAPSPDPRGREPPLGAPPVPPAGAAPRASVLSASGGVPELQLAVDLALRVPAPLQVAQVAERLRQQPRRMAS